MKNKYAKIITVFLIAVMMCSMSGCAAISRYEWRQAYEVYTSEEGDYVYKFTYHTFNATIIDDDAFSDIRKGFCLKIDEDDFIERNKDEADANYTISVYQSLWFYFVDESIVILEENGFFEDINKDTDITFIVHNYIGWNGWGFPVFGVAIGDKTYLDFETGYENVLNFIEAKM